MASNLRTLHLTLASNDCARLRKLSFGFVCCSHISTTVTEKTINPLTPELPQRRVFRPGAPRHNIICNSSFIKLPSRYFVFTGINQRPAGRYFGFTEIVMVGKRVKWKDRIVIVWRYSVALEIGPLFCDSFGKCATLSSPWPENLWWSNVTSLFHLLPHYFMCPLYLYSTLGVLYIMFDFVSSDLRPPIKPLPQTTPCITSPSSHSQVHML